MLPGITDLAVHVIDRARVKARRGTVEAVPAASAKPHRCRRAQRYPDNMFEHRAILVPADAGPCAVFDDQRLLESLRIQARELRSAVSDEVEPIGDGISGGEAAGLKIIGPSKRARQPFAFPLLELEGREAGRADGCDQLTLFVCVDDLLCIRETGKEWNAEEVGLRGSP